MPDARATSEWPPRIRPRVEASRQLRNRPWAERRVAARALVEAIWSHERNSARQNYVEYVALCLT
jgi:hypothetical protein